MTLIEPFRALRVQPEAAHRVAAPPYDVVDREEARRLVEGNPDSFLHVSKPEIDFAPGTDEHSDSVYARGKKNLDRLVAKGLLRREDTPCVYLYRQVMGEHSQTGLVAAASVRAYREGRIKRHEHTQPKKVLDRARNADALDAHTGTLFLTYRADNEIDAQVAALSERQPDIEFTAIDGIRHSVWVVSNAEQIAALTGQINAMPAVYIADGHHRSAAADKLQEWRTAAWERGEPVGPAERFLAVLFPHNQVQILAYNRLVSTLGGRSPKEFVDCLGDAIDVQPSPEPVDPEQSRVFGLYVGGAWYRLTIDSQHIPDDPVAALDINLLEAHCLTPMLGIRDQRTDPRVDFVGGIRGLSELERRVDRGNMKAAFSLHATRLEDVFTVADHNQVMPTKSTWFEPKLRDGLLVLPLS